MIKCVKAISQPIIWNELFTTEKHWNWRRAAVFIKLAKESQGWQHPGSLIADGADIGPGGDHVTYLLLINLKPDHVFMAITRLGDQSNLKYTQVHKDRYKGYLLWHTLKSQQTLIWILLYLQSKSSLYVVQLLSHRPTSLVASTDCTQFPCPLWPIKQSWLPSSQYCFDATFSSREQDRKLSNYSHVSGVTLIPKLGWKL